MRIINCLERKAELVICSALRDSAGPGEEGRGQGDELGEPSAQEGGFSETPVPDSHPRWAAGGDPPGAAFSFQGY